MAMLVPFVPLAWLLDLPGYWSLPGILLLGLITDTRHYFDYHHSPADTVDKIRPADVNKATAALAVLAYVLADLPERWVRPTALPGIPVSQ